MVFYMGNFLDSISGQPFKVNLYMVLLIGSLSTAALTVFNLSGDRYVLCIFWCNSVGIFCFLDGKWQEHFFSWLVLYYKFFVNINNIHCNWGGAGMDRFLLDHFKWFVIVVYYNVSAINVCMNFFNPKQTDRQLCSKLALFWCQWGSWKQRLLVYHLGEGLLEGHIHWYLSVLLQATCSQNMWVLFWLVCCISTV